MSRGGHALAACAVGGFVALARPDGVIVGVAIALAAQIPDLLEIVVGYGATGERYALLPHRTLSHWPYPWLALFVALLLPSPVPLWVRELGIGLSLGALVHLAIDGFSPTGIPLASPFGKRTSVGPYRSANGARYVYRTGSPEEWRLLLPLALVLVGELIAVARSPEVALALLRRFWSVVLSHSG